MTQHSQARFLTFVDIHNAFTFALLASIAATLTLIGFVSTSRAEYDERVVQGYYDDYGEYAYEPEPDCVVEDSPPPPRVYAVPPAPYYGAIWVQPHWYWDDYDYEWVWVDGYYVAPRPGYVYVQPRWALSFGVNVFVGGYFYPAHSHVVYWNSYNHYWWHSPHAYHHYFNYRRPYYYHHDYRRGGYHDRDRADRDYHHNNGRGHDHHDNGVRDHGRGEGRDGHGQGGGRGNGDNGHGNNGQGNNDHGNGQGQGNNDHSHGDNGNQHGNQGRGNNDRASGQGRGNGHDMNRPQQPSRPQGDRSPSRVDRSSSHEFSSDFAMQDQSRGVGRSMSHSRGGQPPARGGRR